MEWRAALKRLILQVFPRAGDYKRRLVGDPASTRNSGDLRKRVRELAARVNELEREIQEARRLNKRIAELTDVVAEVLLPADQRDETRIRSALKDYAKGI